MNRSKDGARATSPRGDINVTPLVDVCLVLLIIFMVVTPMLDPHADVALPKTPKPGDLPKAPERVTIAMKHDGTTWLENRWLPPAELTAHLKELHERAEGARPRGRPGAVLPGCPARSRRRPRGGLSRREPGGLAVQRGVRAQSFTNVTL